MSKEASKLWKRRFLKSRVDESLGALQEAQRLSSKNRKAPKSIATQIDTLIRKTGELQQEIQDWLQKG